MFGIWNTSDSVTHKNLFTKWIQSSYLKGKNNHKLKTEEKRKTKLSGANELMAIFSEQISAFFTSSQQFDFFNAWSHTIHM